MSIWLKKWLKHDENMNKNRTFRTSRKTRKSEHLAENLERCLEQASLTFGDMEELDVLQGTALKHRKIRGFGAITFSKHRKIRYLMQNETEISETSLNTRLWNDHILKTSQNAIPYAQWDRHRPPGRVL